MNVIDLFCGCGGFSKGFEQAGFDIRLGIDIWQDAVTTYKANFPHAATIVGDISTLTGEDLLAAAGMSANEVDVIIGGPPCQGFSLSGKRMLDDPRNILYKSFVRMVETIQPKAFVMENVPGLVRLFNGQVKEQVIEDFTNIGYKVEMRQLTASDFGVPQARTRVFFVGINKDKIKNPTYIFPTETHGANKKPYVTCKDALSDLDFIGDTRLLEDEAEYELPAMSEYQKFMRKNSEKLLNHVTTIHTEKTRSIIAMVPDGGNYKDLPQELWSTRKVNIAWTRMDSQKPCFTIDTGHNHHFHYRANRVPTVRESARIQSFPDDFRFIGIKTSQLKQVGNAVPPLLAQAIAESVISRAKETYKVPYETHPADRLRQCVFGGSSNTMDFLPLDRSGNRRFLPIMVHPERAAVHILEDEAASRAFIDLMWAEAMFIYHNFPVKLTLSKDMEKELKELQKRFMPEDTKAGLIQSFLDNYNGTQVCSKLIYAEALNHPFDDPKQWEIREINEIMNNSIEGWTPFSNPRIFAKYGRQRGWERTPLSGNELSATGSNLPDGFRELTEEEARQMELPF